MIPCDQDAWAAALDELAPLIHPVDRAATRIWFRFFPLRLAEAVAGTTDLAALERRLRLEGRYRLADQVDSSHWFLDGHRYWGAVKTQMAPADSEAASASLTAAIRHLAGQAAGAVQVDVSLLLGISAVAVMTQQQVGAAAFTRPAERMAGASPLAEVSGGHRLDSPAGRYARRLRHLSRRAAALLRVVRRATA